MDRRRLVLSAAAALALPAGRAAAGPPALTAEEAFREASAGRLVLVDIRTPGEWAATGVGRGAYPLDMRRNDFPQALLALMGGDPDRPVALICASGGRSARLARRLRQAGFSRVHDVPEGMTGSRAGPGWIARGLPAARP